MSAAVVGGATVTDLFCGAGGSSSGMAARGASIRMAANHWKLAVESHNANFPDTDHDTADISQVDPRRYPRTDLLWGSPECTNHSQAKGRKRHTAQLTLDEPPLPDEAAERSRATMWDVVRFAEHHRYDVVLVENVVDAARWELFDAWWLALISLGYCAHTVFLNSMHAGDLRTTGVDPAPQSRDRMYVVAHRKPLRCPDLEVRPPAWCAHCDRVVEARQSWKRHDRKPWGRYRAQYIYVCSTAGCYRPVEPYVLPAAAAIDWALAGERIGERSRPLADKTRARIAAGLQRYARPIHLEAAGNAYDGATTGSRYFRAWPADTEPLRALHTTMSKALAVGPGMLVPVEGRDGKTAASVDEVMRTQTARNETGFAIPPLVMRPYTPRGAGGLQRTDAHAPRRADAGTHRVDFTIAMVVPPLVAALRTHSQARPARGEPLMTVCAGTQHQFLVEPPVDAMVMRNNTGGAEMCTPVTEELRTITTKGHQSLVTWAALYAHDAGVRDLGRPLPTQTTVQGDALLTLTEAELIVDDCLFRMLEPHEIQAGMAFAPTYGVLGNKREQVRQLGNAVTPPAAAWLYDRILPILDGAA